MYELIIPALNSNDTEYVLLEWWVASGEPVTSDQPVALLETSKAVEEIPASANGTLEHALAAGSPCRPGTVIGRVLGPDELPSANAEIRSTAAAREISTELFLTNSARALVAQYHVAEESLREIGKRVIRGDDVLGLLGQRPVGHTPVAAGQSQPKTATSAGDGSAVAEASFEVIPLSRIQRAIAATVTAAIAVPAAFTVVKVNLPATDEQPGFPECVIRATAAQRSLHPSFFGRITGDGMLVASPGAQIGISVDAGHGLYMPVLRDAESMSVREISAALLRFRVQARRGRFTATELNGSNIGITLHTESAVVLAQPIIHPENTCALAVCAKLEECQLLPDGSIHNRSYFNLGLAYDHRVINGRDAVLFLDAIKRIVEHPDHQDSG